MIKVALCALLMVLSVITTYAADKPLNFSSAYTHMSKDCKWAYSESELSEGQDNALICKGVGKYRIFIYFSAIDSHLTVQLKNSPDMEVFSQAVRGIDEKKGVIEWRMANGIPFSIIVRSKEYSSQEEDRKITKESLVVRGIDQYSGISGFVDASEGRFANEKARKLADDGYRKILHLKR